jgi:hypothetical protein
MKKEIKYTCDNPKCPMFHKEVNPMNGKFMHPDLGKRDSKICPYCYKPVRITDGRIPA